MLPSLDPAISSGFLPNLISMLVQASVSVKRINSFLYSEELDPYVERSTSDDDIDMRKSALSVEQGTFAWTSGKYHFHQVPYATINS